MTDKIEELIVALQKEIASLKAKQAVSDAALEHLREIYKTAWIESSYDPYNEKSYESAKIIWPHIKALNEELKFRT